MRHLEDLSEFEQRLFYTRILCTNFNFLYQHLNTPAILDKLEERGLIEHNLIEAINKYSETCAQNTLAVHHMQIITTPPNCLEKLCEVLYQDNTAKKLSSGKTQHYKYCTYTWYTYMYVKKAIKARKVYIIIIHAEYQLLAKCGYPRPSSSSLLPHMEPSHFAGLSSAFLKMLSDVIGNFDAHPGSLNTLKQILGKLVLPIGNGQVVALIDPSMFRDTDLVQQLFRLLSPLLNCFSTGLIHYLCEQSHCLNLVEEFHRVCEQHSEAIMCVKGSEMDTDSDVASLPAPLSPGHLKVHTMPLDTLQSLHPLVFTRLDHHRITQPPKTFRLSVEVNRPLITLQDYDNITDAVSAVLLLPKIAMVYAGCSVSPLTLTWLVPAQLHEYLVTPPFGSTASGDRLLAEQGVASVALGEDMYIVCLGIQVCISQQVLQQFTV